MSIELPNLDDRTFTQLVRQARQHIEQTCPEWTDLSAHDPGMTLVEVFAHLTEVLIYRLNRLPDKAYLAFLGLLGVQRRGPVAASVRLELTREQSDGEVVVPAGTRVGVGGGGGKDAIVFATDEACVFASGRSTATVTAHHCERVEGELLAVSDGSFGQEARVSRPPIVSTSEEVDLLVGVETEPSELPEGAPAREWEGRTYRVWEPVWSFAGHPPDAAVYLVDRAEGRITFAPAVDRGRPGETSRSDGLAAAPPAGAEIRIWYRTGGGASGNVAAGSLTTMRDAVPGITVTNPEPARGGRDLEPVDNVIRRGPNEFLTVRRAVTASDFEVLAVASSGSISRAKAVTRADLWAHARPGEVEVVLVPDVPRSPSDRGRVDLGVLTSLQTEAARAATQRELDLRRPLGTRCVVGWARCKPVAVHARVVVGPHEDQERVRARVLARLDETISPVAGPSTDGWRFGAALRRSNIYRLLEQAEPGVEWVDEVSFVVADAPDGAIEALAADRYQPRTWYAASGGTVFRSTNDVDGWEPVASFPGEQVRVVEPYPAPDRPGIASRPGLVAVATRSPDTDASSLHVTEDLGESWRRIGGIDVGITDLAWTNVGDVPGLLIATNTGLYQLPLLPGASPVQVVVDPSDTDRGFYGVVAFADTGGDWWAAVASQAEHGVYLTAQPGRLDRFQHVGLRGQDTRTLAVQLDGTATWLWAGIGEPNPDQPGAGPARARLFEADVRWEPRSEGWTGGTCWALDFLDRVVVAASQTGGVLRLDAGVPNASWQVSDVNSGLPLRDQGRFEPVTVLAAGSAGLVVVGGRGGVHRSLDETHRRWRACDHRRNDEVVTIPGTWLMCSADHEIEVVTARAPR